MQASLQITFRNIPRPDAIEARIRDKAAKLEKFHSRIVSCHILVEERDRHDHGGRQFAVRLDIRVPGHELVIDRDHHTDVYVALHNAFDAAGRRLEEVARTDHGEVKAHQAAQHGKAARRFPDGGAGVIESTGARAFQS